MCSPGLIVVWVPSTLPENKWTFHYITVRWQLGLNRKTNIIHISGAFSPHRIAATLNIITIPRATQVSGFRGDKVSPTANANPR
jgi:hypothetical protein